MGTAESIRSSVRTVIDDLGSTASVYSFSSATKTTNEEGDTTVSNWGNATTIKLVSSNHFRIRRLIEMQGNESNKSERVMLIRDDVSISERDKVVIGTDAYIVSSLKRIDPIEDVLIAQRVVLDKNERYTV